MDQNGQTLNNTFPDLPPDVYLFALQIAGHKHGEGKSKLGVLKHKNGNILKPLPQGDVRASRELSFYENVYRNCDHDSDLSELVKYLPAFHGTLETKDMTYLCLEDVCENFQKPSVLDIKIGLVTHDPTATKEKIRLEKEKYPHAKILGFRILGMKVYLDAEKTYISKDKIFGRQLAAEDIISGLGIFLTENEQLNCLILSGFVHKLVLLSQWFSKQRKFAFYSSSLLFVYEGSTSSWTKWIQSNIMNIHSP
ncbi:Inositol polyphosphate multikinase, partial [Stegodyphus mimosarum]